MPGAGQPRDIEDLIFGGPDARRLTQDSPVAPDVWLAYWTTPNEPVDTLLSPVAHHSSGQLSVALRERMEGRRTAKHAVRLAHTAGHVAAMLSFDELLWAVLPLSRWWLRELDISPTEGLALAARRVQAQSTSHGPSDAQLRWLVELAGLIAMRHAGRRWTKPPSLARRLKALVDLLAGRDLVSGYPDPILLSVNRNRPATPAVYESRVSVKVDAAERLFASTCTELAWAMIDSGVDARHPAFRDRTPDGSLVSEAFEHVEDVRVNRTRVVATYDFRRLRDVQASALEPVGAAPAAGPQTVGSDAMARELVSGRLVDWELLAPHLEVPHGAGYVAPTYPHGTHVAGILAGDWRADEPGLEWSPYDLRGMCPDLALYDLRVLGDDGKGSEFAILAALQFVRDFNARGDRMRIHGVNLSISLDHDFRTRACGQTAVCREAAALVASGVVVVAAAGTDGMATFTTSEGLRQGFRTVAITDPGNTEDVITVGATHRSRPHEYGVSYFSSRGPTGDGRMKPDLVAPGERIEAPFPEGARGVQDGTSMAAPHVSGAAALLLARHRELIGQPREVKRLLCQSATDLGRRARVPRRGARRRATGAADGVRKERSDDLFAGGLAGQRGRLPAVALRRGGDPGANSHRRRATRHLRQVAAAPVRATREGWR
jgi:serine protease AprX